MTLNHSGRAFYSGLLEALTQVMGTAKIYLRDHGPRVALLAGQIGGRMGLSRREQSELFFAAVLCDMGMVGLAEGAWENPVPELPPDVRARVELHPLRSERRVASIPHLEHLAPLVRHHHEWYDGSGYPDGLAGTEIPLGAQILRLADTVAALTQERPHRGPLGPAEIVEVVRSGIGSEFGPEAAVTFLDMARAKEVPGYDPNAFRHTTARAAHHLIPDEVSPLSSEQLLDILANLIDAKHPYTAGHSRRVALLSAAVASHLGIQESITATVWAGGYLHDLGKLEIPLRILMKGDDLTDEEFEVVKRHPTAGAGILETIPSLRHLTTCARYHHERWDGSGYPEGLSGEHIPVVAQILAVCDAYDAMTSKRAYRGPRPHEDAMHEVASSAGVHFGPRVAAAFLGLPEAIFDSVRAARPEEEESLFPPQPAAREARVGRDRSVAR